MRRIVDIRLIKTPFLYLLIKGRDERIDIQYSVLHSGILPDKQERLFQVHYYLQLR